MTLSGITLHPIRYLRRVMQASHTNPRDADLRSLSVLSDSVSVVFRRSKIVERKNEKKWPRSSVELFPRPQTARSALWETTLT